MEGNLPTPSSPLDDSRAETLHLLNPSHDAESRRSTVRSIVVALIATMMGGSVLSLPWALAHAGLLPGVMAIIFWALASDFSVYVLVRCARRAGLASYEDVAASAFGPRMRLVVGMLVFMLCWMVTVGYIVLAGDMGRQTYAAAFGFPVNHPQATSWSKAIVALLVLPASLAGNLHSLRYTCILSLLAVILIASTLAYKASHHLSHFSPSNVGYHLWPVSPGEFFYTFSLFSGGYVCHFNILPAHAELSMPTRTRVHWALHLTMIGCLLMYISVAVAGYLYTGQMACDNVLLNFCHTDVMMAAGRLCILIVLILNLPLIVLPARQALDGILAACPPRSRGSNPNEDDHSSSFGSGSAGATLAISSRACKTLVIVGSALALAVTVPGVHLVWTLLSGTVSMTLAYILPPMMYLQLRARHRWNWRKVGCVLLILLGVFTAVASTYQTVQNFKVSSSCPTGYDPCAPTRVSQFHELPGTTKAGTPLILLQP